MLKETMMRKTVNVKKKYQHQNELKDIIKPEFLMANYEAEDENFKSIND